MKPVVLRAVDRARQPWKNGGGVTREILSVPAGSTMDDFSWRLSMAEVREAGPFSLFPNIDRILMVLEGRLELDFGGEQPTVELMPGGPAHSFAGDVPVAGTPIDGGVIDLNLMARRGMFAGAIRHQAAGVCRLDAGDTKLRMLIATSATELRCGKAEHRLGRFDVLLIPAGTREIECLQLSRSMIIADVAAIRMMLA